MTRSDETEGGEEGKGKGEEGGEGGEEILADGRAHGPIKGSTRGPRGPKKPAVYLSICHLGGCKRLAGGLWKGKVLQITHMTEGRVLKLIWALPK